ncbi:GrpB family protein [Alkalibacillus haloalkaliphilus]|uniref:GrpB family protein n=1 Tax=Alkalibacillus haloalkaliphilus TaxID=94136 RepID=UPI0029358948|nr:GrpB family protein [Alkalibacillus haloalkaliphilus]MDV2582362.1 GrpB family protein [Alkalibacillus haloalkaliphilus]
MKVRLTDYDENWPEMFKAEAEFLETIFSDEIIRFEHFGSTSVKGMKAKPVIDMMCIVKDIEKVDSFNGHMDSLGYDVAREWGIVGRRLFRKGGENRSHHIHFYQFDHPEIERHLVFRDYLRVHPQEASRYSRFKEDLTKRYDTTREYSLAKKKFVSDMEQKALRWYKDINSE